MNYEHILTEIPDGGSTSLGNIGDTVLMFSWKPDAYDEDHPCCKIRKDNPELKMELRGKFTREGETTSKDIYFFLGQTFANLYINGVAQPGKDWLGYPQGAPKMDKFFIRNNIKGFAVYNSLVERKPCHTRKVTFN